MKELLISIFFFTIFLSPAISVAQEKENLGENINSPYGEVNPVISPDGKTLFFCRDKHPDNLEGEYNKTYYFRYKKKQSQDIWYSEKKPDGSWSDAKNIGKPLNTEYPNFVLSVSPDGNTLLLGGLYKIDGRWTTGVFISNRTLEGWGYPQKLNIKNENNKSRVVNYYLSSNGKTMLMQLERDDGFGGTDLYVSFREDDLNWSEPLNLGDVVNTPENERTPFLAADGVSLYFSSRGRGGFGDYDVFLSRRLDDTWLHWTKPMNLGATINTKSENSFYKLSASGDFAYFASPENSLGERDIFKVILPEHLKPKPVVVISGKVLNSQNGEPIEAKIFYQILPQFAKAGEARSNPKTGEYQIILPAGKAYQFHAEASGFLSVSDNIDLSEITEYKQIRRDLKLNPIGEPYVIVTGRVIDAASRTPLKAQVIFRRKSESGTRGATMSDENDGKYQITLPVGEIYEYNAETENYEPVYGELDVSGVTRNSEMSRDIEMVAVGEGETINMRNITFEYRSASITKESITELEKLAKFMKNRPYLRIEIGGHTDDRGSDSYNQKLSESRAKSVAEFLTGRGVPFDKVSYKGYGETQPIAPNDTPQGRELNRRVEFKLLK